MRIRVMVPMSRSQVGVVVPDWGSSVIGVGVD
ncbi:MAG: hypothetical protein G01um101416_1191 [Microgenomates group bacterium Gr01-1014_16]|nr:MAG: hypothetical protein G01um101416_1191 [Microgenomates group bacterium Gr01-1014_16]